MSGNAFHRRSLRSRLGFGPQIRSGVRQLHWCGLGISTRSGPPHIGRTHTDGRCTLLALIDNKRQLRAPPAALPSWLGRARDGVHCSGSGQTQPRGTTTIAHLHFFHRCSISRTSLRTATWRQSHLLLRNLKRTQQPAPNIRWAWRWTLGNGVQQGMGRVSVESVTLCQLNSSHEKRLQQTVVCRRRLCLHVKAADLGPKARMSPILVWTRKLER